MSDRETISEELLNAFVDGELDEGERQRILELQLQDPQIARKVQELERLKGLVKAARPVDESPASGLPRRGSTGVTRAKLASVAVLLGVVLGAWLYWPEGTPQLAGRPEPTAQDVYTLVNPGTGLVDMKVVIHFTRSQREAAKALLDQVEYLLERAQRTDRRVRVEVVAHGKGLYLLRDGVSPFPERIRALHERFDNLTFLACEKTMTKLKQAKKIDVELLPDATVVRSGIEQIRLRRSQGWDYIVV